jgi:galactokinase/mevalonate kinase-like predicted kinase
MTNNQTGLLDGRRPGLYRWAQQAGALGNKLCGARRGGFLFFVVPVDHQQAARNAVSDLNELRMGHQAHGAQIISVE